VRNEQEPSLTSMPYRDLAKLLIGVVRVGKGQSRPVGKDRSCLFERNPVFARVGRSFFRVPFKDHACKFTESATADEDRQY